MTFQSYQQANFEGATPTPGADPNGYMMPPDQGAMTWFDGGLITFKAKGLDTNNILSFFQCDVPYGWKGPVHRHAHESELFYITEGEWEVFVNDTVHDVRPGSVVWIPPGAPHSLFVNSPRGRGFCVVNPGGFEQFFEDVGEPATVPSMPTHQMAAPSVDDLARAGAKFGWELVEPEPRRLQR